ncbi:MAG: hypothetical protein OEW82_04665, partial [Dehalococcoidia bacterium]|nr:hypothetical protein [Dehalococcoidia bacterium]
AILVVQLSSLFSIGVIYSRVSAEMGQWWAQFWHDQEGWFRGTQESWIADPQSPLFMPDPQARYLTARAAIYEEMGTMKAGNPMALMMENYKMGSLSGLHSKYVLLGGIIAIVVALVIGMFAFTGFWQTFGAKKLTQFAYTGPPNNMPQRSATYIAQEVSGISYLRGFWNNWSYNVAQVTGFSVGTVIAVAIYLIKARVPWFPLSPAGWALSAFFSTAPLLLPIIIGFVAKTLAARLGRDYDEKLLKPIAIGILVGCTLVNLATGLYEYGQVLTR